MEGARMVAAHYFGFVLLLACSTTPTLSFDLVNASALETDLLTGYKKTIRPLSLTEVNMGMGVMHIVSLDIVAQHIHLIGYIYGIWTDPRLSWNATDYGDMYSTPMSVKDVWMPPVVLSNAADGLSLLNTQDGMDGSYLYAYHTGTIVWYTSTNFVAQCQINVEYYPFDSQDCEIIITPWTIDAEDMTLYSKSQTVDTFLFEENGEWDLVYTSVQNYTRKVGNDDLPGVKFNLRLKRKVSYYLINMILPVIFLAIVGTFVFVLPVESGEKNGYALTILLSMSVIMTIVSDAIPPISTQTCQLSVYLLVIFIVCSLETILTVMSCQIHSYDAKGYKPGQRAQKIAKFLAKLSLYRRASDHSTNRVTPKDDIVVQNMEKPELTEAWKDEVPDKSVSYNYIEVAFLMDRVLFGCFLSMQILFTLVFCINLRIQGDNTGNGV
ncbi:neuronal acetylcholine receptor subunit beta-3-like isoform X1 [Mya arenaria]|uniref:neuronal acetylcholine receptor subunit beta-3-like isoform X1 n=1 Tax=Mya arenaria TaxID=6604 RepID=UPI0022E27FB9|nr:neuronal acetylcholine receptor subunit beta-3-like isoform X1 [Mya arenaria]